MSLAGSLLSLALEAISRRSESTGRFRAAIGTIVRYPIRAIALFLTAPFLAFKVATAAKNPLRRWMARAGLVIAVILAWLAGTILGSIVGALLVASHVSLLMGIGFLLGTTLSVILSGTFCLVVFNATSLLFLKMSTQEVIDYLQREAA